jgi:hypothetical protein
VKDLRTITVWLVMAFGLLITVRGPAVSAVTAGQSASEPTFLYRAAFLRAAPGKLLDLIALLKTRMDSSDASGDERPFWWRHTQGDQWDLMLIYPMGSYGEFYAPDRLARRRQAAESGRGFQEKLDACVSWKEDLFVFGPPLEHLRKEFGSAAYFHIEIMVSLPGKQAELIRERRMESAYQVAMGRPEYMLFVRDQGASWDVFTLACYRDLKHWAESPDLTREQREDAARRAGFKSPDEIGPYMRTLIDMHRDTMGVAIK